MTSTSLCVVESWVRPFTWWQGGNLQSIQLFELISEPVLAPLQLVALAIDDNRAPMYSIKHHCLLCWIVLGPWVHLNVGFEWQV